ncbi:uncharacterized protein LOC100901629 [Trichonephila clavipes]|nr:uncharacterized protein LOC100901629 [Trichonephila clavipes]
MGGKARKAINSDHIRHGAATDSSSSCASASSSNASELVEQGQAHPGFINEEFVLDASILSRFCKCPNKMHNENCKTNHFGNSGSMEVSGAIEIFQRSESLYGLRYTKFLGDGDARAYNAVNEMQPY